MRLYAIIVAGGSGTRLWPLSRKSEPKQILPVLGGDSLLSATWKRLRSRLPASRILLVTNPLIAERAHRELPELPKDNLIVEPIRRETAQALGLGAAVLAARDPKAVLINVNSDAHVHDAGAWWRAALKAAQAADKRNRLVLVGLRPTYPETGYGYIKMGRSAREGLFEVEGFREKPDLETAKTYVARWDYLWNLTMIAARAEDLLAAFRRHLPKSWKQLDRIRRSWKTPRREATLSDAFPRTEAISIDYGLLEKEKGLLVLPADFAWSDIGHWRTVHDALSGKSKRKNVARCHHVSVDSEGNLLYSFTGKLIAAVGLKDMIVVETGDAILVCPKSKAQDVKKIVEELERKKMKKYL
jgi:mannose-1-phosphate guanylyltransferase